MPELSWKELSKIKHHLGNDMQCLHFIQKAIIDNISVKNTDKWYFILEQIDTLLLRLKTRQDDLFDIVSQHEDEN